MRRPGSDWEPRHFLIFAVALVLSILVAVWASSDATSLFSGLQLENADEMAVSPVETFAIGVRGPVEVSGIRPYYDEDFQTHVKAFVANHSRHPQSVALQVLLRVREASQHAPPLATFQVIIPDPIGPNGGTEIDVVLNALGQSAKPASLGRDKSRCRAARLARRVRPYSRSARPALLAIRDRRVCGSCGPATRIDSPIARSLP